MPGRTEPEHVPGACLGLFLAWDLPWYGCVGMGRESDGALRGFAGKKIPLAFAGQGYRENLICQMTAVSPLKLNALLELVGAGIDFDTVADVYELRNA